MLCPERYIFAVWLADNMHTYQHHIFAHLLIMFFTKLVWFILTQQFAECLY